MGLRVLFLTTFFPRPLNLMLGPWALKQAHALVRNGVDLRVVSPNPYVPKFLARSSGAKAYALVPSQYTWDGLTVHYPRWLSYPINPIKRWEFKNPQPYLRIGWWSVRSALLNALREHQPQVIFAHHTAVNGYLAWQLKQRFGIPYIITDHDYGEIEDCQRLPHRAKLFRKVTAQASALVGVSRRMTESMARLFPGVPALTVYNGTDPIPSAIQNTPRLPELAGKQVIFTAAMFYTRKGIPLLIQAFAKIAAKYPNALLRIAGDGDERSFVDRAIAEAGLQSRVMLLGKQSQSAVLQEMVWCDFFALIGWDEPFATVFIEAMSAAKPILCANDGGINDVVRDGIHGRMIPPRDLNAAAAAIDNMLSDPPALTRMGAAARELFVTQLNWDANARRMIELFDQAAASAAE